MAFGRPLMDMVACRVCKLSAFGAAQAQRNKDLRPGGRIPIFGAPPCRVRPVGMSARQNPTQFSNWSSKTFLSKGQLIKYD